MKNYSEDGYRKMVETGEKNRRAHRKNQIDLSERKKLEYLGNPKKCLVCDSIVSFEKRENNHCSMSCAATSRNKGVRRHGNPGEIAECLICGKSTKPGRKYCGQKCSGKRSKFSIEAWLKGEITGDTSMGCSSAI